MVKTRAQITENEKETEKLKAIPPTALPPKVCQEVPSTPSRISHPRPPSSETKSLKKKKLKFAAAPPEEFPFEIASPPARRMRPKQHDVDVHDSVVRIEFEIRGNKSTPPVEIGEKERNKYQEWVSRDYREELEKHHGILCDDNNVSKLKERLELAETLRRRVEITRCNLAKAPNTLPFAEVQKGLCSRRIEYVGLTYYQACESLERALLKEDAQGLVGEGYQFGRRLVSATDIIEYQQPSDKEMRDMLMKRGVTGNTIPKKKTEKAQLLSQLLELEEESNIQREIIAELIRDLTRRKIDIPETRELNPLFAALFDSGKWKTDYDDVDNSPLSEEHASNCVIA